MDNTWILRPLNLKYPDIASKKNLKYRIPES